MANEIDTTLLDNLNSIKNSKADIKQALIDKGQNPTNVFADYAQLISDIQTGEDLSEELSAQEAKLAQLESILENKTAGGKVKLNIFMQETEPEIKNGIWLQSNKSFDKVISTKIISSEPFWNNNEITQPTPIECTYAGIICINNNIYMFKGTKAYRYDIIEDKYYSLKDIPYNLSEIRVSYYYNNFIYLINANYTIKYDISNDEYTQLAKINAINANSFSGVGAENYIYCFGVQLSSTKRYNILQNSWETLAYQDDIAYSTFCYYNGFIYIFGSYTKNMYNYAYKYDILNNKFTRIANVPDNEMRCGSCITYNNSIYVFCGNSKKCYEYIPLENKYIELPDIPKITTGTGTGASAKAVSNNQKIYLVGGYKNETGIQVLVFPQINFDENSIVIDESSSNYETEIITTDVENGLHYKFNDALFNTENGFDYTIPTYYGDGTQWIKFKN